MAVPEYRIEPKTGAIIFKKSAGRERVRQTEIRLKALEEKVEKLERENQELRKLVESR